MTTNPASRAPEGTAPTPEFITVGGAMFSREAPEEPRPTADEIRHLCEFLQVKADDLRDSAEGQMPGTNAQRAARAAFVTDWIVSHLPALLAADADRQRLEGHLARLVGEMPDRSLSPRQKAIFGIIDAARSSSPTTGD